MPFGKEILLGAGLLLAAGILIARLLGVDVPLGTLIPVAAILGGAAIAWMQLDETRRAGLVDKTKADQAGGWARLAAGLALVVAGVLVMVSGSGSWEQTWLALLASVAVLGGVALVLLPWGLKFWRDLETERAGRVRATERAEIAAHLHDSVLQTLALIQRRAGNEHDVIRLARAQERELRGWLYRDADKEAGQLSDGIKAAAAEVEDALGNAVEVVSVGDCRHDPTPRGPRPGSPRGHAERRPARRRRRVRLPGSHRRRRGSFRQGPGPGLRPGFGSPGPARRPGIDHRPDEPPRRHRRHHQQPGRHRSAAPAARRRRRRNCRDCRQQRQRRGQAVTSPASETQRSKPSQEAPHPVRVVIVDDHAIFRSGLKADLDPDIVVAGEAGTVEEAIAVIAVQRPDVVLLDVHLPGGRGGGGREVLAGSAPLLGTTRFLALSVSDAAEDVVSVIRAGARGYVTKTISGAEISGAVRRVAGGDAVFSPRLAGFVLDAFGTAPADIADDELDRLSARELEVMRLIARGYSYKEVAKELFISIKTVETHVSAVLRKLQLSSRHELTRWAAERRLL